MSRGGRRPDCAGQTARQLPLNTHTADDGRLAADRATAVAVRSTVRAIPTGPDAPAIAREAIAETGAIADPSARYQAQLVWGRDPVLPKDDFDRLRRGLVSSGYIRRSAAYEACVDNSLARQVTDE